MQFDLVRGHYLAIKCSPQSRFAVKVMRSPHQRPIANRVYWEATKSFYFVGETRLSSSRCLFTAL